MKDLKKPKFKKFIHFWAQILTLLNPNENLSEKQDPNPRKNCSDHKQKFVTVPVPLK